LLIESGGPSRPLDLGSLNPEQLAAVTHGNGPLLIFAGAGSGKTRVLTMRIAHLLRARGVGAERILALTFTNRAAREIRSRLTQLLGAQKGLWVGTFHSIAVRMLRPHAELLGYRPGFAIYDEEDSRALLKRTLSDLQLDSKKHPLGPLQQRLGRERAQGGSVEDAKFALVADRYRALCVESNGMDFDDILINLRALFVRQPEVLQLWQSRFDHVLVDEYQDTNRVQYEILRSLAGPHRNLTVVGDDDQSIYAFRGADPRNLLEFERDFPEATVVKLEQNYRSTQGILDLAHQVIEKNRERSPKRLWSADQTGSRPVLILAGSDDQEAAWVAERIDRLALEEGIGFGQCAILFRTNAQARAYERALVERRIRYHLVGGLRFWDRREIKDLICFLRLLNNPEDAVSFDRIANVPRRGVSERTAQAVIAAAAESGSSLLETCAKASGLELREEARAALSQFAAEMVPLAAEARRRPPSELLLLIIRRCALAEHYDDGTRSGQARLDNLAELRSLVSDYDHLGAARGLERFLTDVALSTDSDETEAGERVTLITLHMAKGLEWPVVFLTGLEDKLLPHERARFETGGLEEERRLAYVGITRARQQLHLTCAAVRHVFGKTLTLRPSSFLGDALPGQLDLVELEGHAAPELAARHRQRAEGGPAPTRPGRPPAWAPSRTPSDRRQDGE